MRDNRDRNSIQFKHWYLSDLLKPCISSVLYILTIAKENIHSAKSNLLFYCFTQRLSFSDLLLFNTETRLPTLLPNKTILITNTSATNFTLNNSPITRPNVYATNAVTVHGIAVLDYSIYGNHDTDGLRLSLPKPPPQQPQLQVSPADHGSTIPHPVISLHLVSMPYGAYSPIYIQINQLLLFSLILMGLMVR